MLCYLFNTVKRLFLFGFVFVFAYLNFRNISKSSYDFKDKVYEFTTGVNFKHPLLDQYLANPTQVFQAFLIAQVAFALLATLGVRFFSFLSGLLLVLVNVLYYNPLRATPGSKTPNFSLQNLDLKTLSSAVSAEFLLLTCLSLAMFAQSFNNSSRSVTHIQVEAQASSTSSDSRRDSRPASGKKKKTI